MRMHFNTCAVQAYGLHANTDYVFLLKPLKKTLQTTIFAPTVHPNINRMPIPIGFRQCPPFAAVFRDIQYRIYQLEIAHANITALPRQIFCDFFKLFLIEFHAKQHSTDLELFKH